MRTLGVRTNFSVCTLKVNFLVHYPFINFNQSIMVGGGSDCMRFYPFHNSQSWTIFLHNPQTRTSSCCLSSHDPQSRLATTSSHDPQSRVATTSSHDSKARAAVPFHDPQSSINPPHNPQSAVLFHDSQV
jgi:hypothetical protein